MRRLFALTAAALLGGLLVACQSETPTAVSASQLEGEGPAEVTERIAANLKEDNLLGAIQAAIPPADFETLQLEYEKDRKQPPSPADSAEYAMHMKSLTESDAETKLMAELEPLLVKYETEIAGQLPMFLAMGRGYSQQWLQEEKTLSAEQKTQLGQVIDAVAKWLESVNFADRARAKQAIAKVVATARTLDLPTLEAVRALTFEEAMGKAGLMSAGVKDVLAVYGFDINANLASIEAKVLEEAGDTARLSVSYRLFDQALSTETAMVRRDGRWYGKDTLAKLDRERSAPAVAREGDDESGDGSDDFRDSDDVEDEATAPAGN